MPEAPRKLVAWALAGSLGGFLFGFHAGVISGALLSIREELRLGELEQGILVSLLPLGAMAGGLLAGRLADVLGRRRMLALDAVVFLIGTVLAAIAPGYVVLLIARAVLGLAVGVASSTVPLYLSEIAPTGVRGRIMTLNQVMITLGILASYCVNLIFAGSGGWRAMFATGLLPAAALLAGILRSPETPSWLETHGHGGDARTVLLAIADEDESERFLEDVRLSRDERAERMTVRELIGSPFRPALMIGVTLAALQQLSGINAVIYYAPSIMERTGLSASGSILSSVLIGTINLLTGVVSLRLVDRAGRRPLLLISLLGMLVPLALLGLTFQLSLGSAESLLSLGCILGYIVAFAIGLGPIFWLLIAEIFPADARASGVSVSTTMSWFTNFIVGLAFLPLASAVGEAATFWAFAVACLVAFGFVNRYVPETKGRGFAEIDREVRVRWSREPGRAAA